MIQSTDPLPAFRKVGIKEGPHLCAVRVGLGWVDKVHVSTLIMAVLGLSTEPGSLADYIRRVILRISRGQECSSMDHRQSVALSEDRELARQQCRAVPGWYLRKWFRHEHS